MAQVELGQTYSGSPFRQSVAKIIDSARKTGAAVILLGTLNIYSADNSQVIAFPTDSNIQVGSTSAGTLFNKEEISPTSSTAINGAYGIYKPLGIVAEGNLMSSNFEHHSVVNFDRKKFTSKLLYLEGISFPDIHESQNQFEIEDVEEIEPLQFNKTKIDGTVKNGGMLSFPSII